MPKVLIISLTPVLSEPRVIRQADYFISQGFEVIVAGFSGKDQIKEKWDFIDLSDALKVIPKSSYSRWSFYKILTALFYRLCKYTSFLPYFAEKRYWYDIIYRNILTQLELHPANLIICHDYYTAPIAHHLGRKFGVKVVIDVHEHAVSQKKTDSFFKNIKWFFIDRSYASSLQKKFLPRMHKIITICDGIGKDLQKSYGLAEMPVVIRSIPFYSSQTLNLTLNNINILYLGLVAPGRGLEDCIKAINFLPLHFRLTIQGSGEKLYIESIIELIHKEGLENRVILKDPVPFLEIVSSANQYDIGVFVTKNIGLQKKYVLPNKFFEYIMAGLALCVSDLPEMARIVRQYDIGLLISKNDPKLIAQAIGSLTPKKIDFYKQNSLKAAKELNWKMESKKLDFIVKILNEES